MPNNYESITLPWSITHLLGSRDAVLSKIATKSLFILTVHRYISYKFPYALVASSTRRIATQGRVLVFPLDG
jgi:ACT domain-containing protein